MKTKVLIGIFLCLIICFIVDKCDNKETKTTIITVTKDSLIRDSIYIINDSITTKIKYIEKEHAEKIPIIMSNSVSDDKEFFSRYINSYNNRE
jgi:oligoribonuclease (3'-5' exoribonuclease)